MAEKCAIVIPTHRSGIKFLDNLLKSFNGYSKYPIIIVISEYKERDSRLFLRTKKKFTELPVSLEKIYTNSFELGGLFTAYKNTDYDEFFLLPHSCEIVNAELFEIIFEKYKDKSVALGLQSGNWGTYWQGLDRQNKKVILKYLDKDTNNKLINAGDVTYWQGHVGKYLRRILDKINLLDFLPTNIIEAITKSELLFTSKYFSLDKDTIVLFKDWIDSKEKTIMFGRLRKKIANEYIIKYKTHWSPNMVIDSAKYSAESILSIDKIKYLLTAYRNKLRYLLEKDYPALHLVLRTIKKGIF